MTRFVCSLSRQVKQNMTWEKSSYMSINFVSQEGMKERDLLIFYHDLISLLSLDLIFSFSWTYLHQYLNPLRDHIPDFNRIEYTIRRQQYLEALTWQSVVEASAGIVPWRPLRHHSEYTTTEKEEKIDMELVVQSLKILEPLCSQKVLIDYLSF